MRRTCTAKQVILMLNFLIHYIMYKKCNQMAHNPRKFIVKFQHA